MGRPAWRVKSSWANTKKKQLTISAGNIHDYEAGTSFFERRSMKGKRAKSGPTT